LIELVAALSVLSIGLLGVVQSYHYGIDKIRTLREASVAGRAVQDQIEALRTMPFAKLTDRDKAALVDPAPDLSQLVNATPTLTIRPYSGSALRLKEVEVSIRWTGDNGRTMKRSATTLIADKEPAK
jgi:type II secretory pathway pseudopilin PulG